MPPAAMIGVLDQHGQRRGRRQDGGVEDAAVAARLRALDAERVDSGRDGQPGLVRVGDRADRVRTHAPEPCQDVGRGQPEGEGDDGHRVRHELMDLLGPEVGVREVGLWQVDAGRGRLGRQRLAVPRDRVRLRDRLRNEHVHTEQRPVARQLPHLLDLRAHGRGRQIAGREEAEPAGPADRRGELRGRRTSGHRSLDDTESQVSELERHQGSFRRLGSTLPGRPRPPAVGGCRWSVPASNATASTLSSPTVGGRGDLRADRWPEAQAAAGPFDHGRIRRGRIDAAVDERGARRVR
jgi:hypothetical protein